jgi:SAM-dependent methyltransferase
MEKIEYETLAGVELDHWWYGGMRAIAAGLLDPLYGRRRDLRILDAGCGTGGDGLFLRRYGCVSGVDLAPEAVTLAAPRLNGRLSRATVQQLPFADESFDLVTSFDVLYHRGVENEVAVLREFRRLLRPGGRLLLRLPAYEFLRSRHDAQVHTRRRYRAGQVEDMLIAGGFWVERLSYVVSLLFPIPLAQRLLERLLPPPAEPASAMQTPSSSINRLLRLPMAFEAAWISLGGRFPFGLSIVCLAHAGKIRQVRLGALQP